MSELDIYQKARLELEAVWVATGVAADNLVMAYAEVCKTGKPLPCEHGDDCSNDGDYFIQLKPCCRHHHDLICLPQGN